MSISYKGDISLGLTIDKSGQNLNASLSSSAKTAKV